MENLISVEKGVFAEKDWKRGKELTLSTIIMQV
jgi:hypothetical protein